LVLSLFPFANPQSKHDHLLANGFLQLSAVSAANHELYHKKNVKREGKASIIFVQHFLWFTMALNSTTLTSA